MRNLLAFLYRIRIFMLFVILEAIAFSWITASRSYQRSVVFNSANAISGGALEKASNIEEYFDLKQQNDKLAKENAFLRSTEENSFFTLTADSTLVTDSSQAIRYSYITAEVISSSYQKARNFMTINRGKVHGVDEGMGRYG